MLLLNKSATSLAFLISLELCWTASSCLDLHHFPYVPPLLLTCLALPGCFDPVYGFRLFGTEMLKYSAEVSMHHSLHPIDI